MYSGDRKVNVKKVTFLRTAFLGAIANHQTRLMRVNTGRELMRGGCKADELELVAAN